MLTAVGNDAAALSRWVTASDTLVDAFEIVAKHGFVAYWQDTLGITLFSMGEFCVKIFSTVYPATQTTILSWMERSASCCSFVLLPTR